MCPRLGMTGLWPRLGMTGLWPRLGRTGMWPRLGSPGMWLRLGSTGMWLRLGSTGMWPRLGSTDMWLRLGSTGMWLRLGSTGMWPRLWRTGMRPRLGSTEMWPRLWGPGMRPRLGSTGMWPLLWPTGMLTTRMCARPRSAEMRPSLGTTAMCPLETILSPVVTTVDRLAYVCVEAAHVIDTVRVRQSAGPNVRHHGGILLDDDDDLRLNLHVDVRDGGQPSLSGGIGLQNGVVADVKLGIHDDAQADRVKRRDVGVEGEPDLRALLNADVDLDIHLDGECDGRVDRGESGFDVLEIDFAVLFGARIERVIALGNGLAALVMNVAADPAERLSASTTLDERTCRCGGGEASQSSSEEYRSHSSVRR